MDGATRASRCGVGALRLGILTASLILGCSTPYIGTTAPSFLRQVRENPDPNIRYLAYSKLASPDAYDSEAQKSQAVRLLVRRLHAKDQPEPVATRAVICRTLGELRDPWARDAVRLAIEDPNSLVRAEACRALGKLGEADDAALLARIMVADKRHDCRIAAIEGLGELHSEDPRILRLLLDGMVHQDPAIRFASLKALRTITHEDHGPDRDAWLQALEPLLSDEERADPGPEPSRTSRS